MPSVLLVFICCVVMVNVINLSVKVPVQLHASGSFHYFSIEGSFSHHLNELATYEEVSWPLIHFSEFYFQILK
jgi:hypothetical protein